MANLRNSRNMVLIIRTAHPPPDVWMLTHDHANPSANGAT
jgi:hypothetical protein